MARGDFVIDDSLVIPVTMEPDALRERLRQMRPYGGWRHLIQFTNGVKTSDIEMAKPWSDTPLIKIRMVERAVPDFAKRGGRALDIGCNIGYNSLYLAHAHGMDVVGIDVTNSHLAVCQEFAKLSGLERAKFLMMSAETYCEPDGFDLVVHFGTLYHLRNPMLALEAASRNLKMGGVLALETQCHGEKGALISRYVHGFNDDPSNWWALGDGALRDMLAFCGFDEPVEVFHWTSPLLDGMYRIIWVMRKRREIEEAYDDMLADY
jgi:SAM-dependent methyltransferase